MIRRAILGGIGVAVLSVSVLAWANPPDINRSGTPAMSPQTIATALKAHTSELMSLSGVVGTAQSLCNGHPCIKVFVVRARPALTRKIHAILSGYPVVVEETGMMRARPAK